MGAQRVREVVSSREDRPKSIRVGAYKFASDPEGKESLNENDDPIPNPKPQELILLDFIDRFGVMAVLGRSVLFYGEVYRMRTAELIVNGYRLRARAESWAKFAAEHPAENSLLMDAEKLANG